MWRDDAVDVALIPVLSDNYVFVPHKQPSGGVWIRRWRRV